MQRHLEGKVAIVTGGTGALGSAVVARFLAAGAKVHATYIKDEEAAALSARLGDSAALALHKVDLTDESAVNSLVDTVVAGEGRLDVLANIAGGFAGGAIAASSSEKLETALAVNLRTCFLCCRKAAEAMAGAGAGGRIINVGAKAALAPAPKMACYAAAKAAVLGLTAALARELGPAGITVNAILPGTIDTPANRRAMPKADFSRWTQPEAIAEAFTFLASDAAAAVNGAQIPL
jgi:NAD(P)-dependent dehydrogenase (short-subunit alcohol dehydrogenase family)